MDSLVPDVWRPRPPAPADDLSAVLVDEVLPARDDRPWPDDQGVGVRLAALIAFGLVIFVLGLTAVRLAARGTEVAAWWPAAGVSVAVLARYWRSRWALAAAVIVFSALANVAGGRSWPVSFGFGVSNAIEALVAAGCLWWLSGGPPSLRRLVDVGRLLVAAVAGAVAIAAGVAVTLTLFGEVGIDGALLNVIPSHVAAVLLIVPLSLSPAAVVRRGLAEVAGSWALTVLVVLVVFGPVEPRPLAFVMIGPLVWAATRLGLRHASMQLIVVGVSVTLLTAHGRGPFVDAAFASGGSNPLVQAFVISCALVVIPLAVLTAQGQRSLERMTASEELFRRGFEEAIVSLLLLRIEGRSVRAIEVNEAAESKLGLRAGDYVPSSLIDDDDRTLGAIGSGLRPGEGWRGEMSFPLDAHDVRRFAVAVSRLSGDDSRQLATCQVVDVTDRYRAELELKHLALHDPLTGLPNRVLLDSRLSEDLRSDRPVALMFADLDDFKLVNDTSGHRLGDQILVAVAERLTGCVHDGDTVARMGGDEFVLVLRDVTSTEGAMRIADRIWAAIEPPVETGELTYKVDLSIGVALSTAGTTSGQLLSQADTALYSAKSNGKRRAVVYTEALGSAAADQVRLEAELHVALREGQFRLWVQPVVEIDSGRWVAAEALIRWQHPERGLLGPDTFLHVAERAGLMARIGEWMLDEACRQAAGWSHAVGPDTSPVVQVNVSAGLLDQPGLSGTVLSALQRHQLPPSKLVLEVTETHLAEIDDAVLQEFGALVAHGVRFAADDYGTGYSPLARITELPIDMIKIDREFVRSLTADRRAHAVVASLEELARTIGLSVVADGVEDLGTAAELRDIGVELGQGCLWQGPLAPGNFAELLPANTATTDEQAPRSGPLSRGDLAAGIDRGELVVLFQPLVGADDRLCKAVEALVRWQHPTKGLISPLDFIPMAEAGGLIGPLTQRVLEESLRECARWLSLGEPLSVSVNFSPVLLDDPSWPGRVAALLETHQLGAEFLTLEITESALADPTPEVTAMLDEMRAIGVRFSVDDFGTGYTSLALLRQFALDEMKIDGSFVSDMLTSPTDAAIVRAMLDLGHSLGLVVVAECVRDEQTAQVLEDLGCDVLQGFHFSPPVPGAELGETLHRLRRRASAHRSRTSEPGWLPVIPELEGLVTSRLRP
jgi:diguanylate cyclase (GGDEF)-like protein